RGAKALSGDGSSREIWNGLTALSWKPALRALKGTQLRWRCRNSMFSPPDFSPGSSSNGHYHHSWSDWFSPSQLPGSLYPVGAVGHAALLPEGQLLLPSGTTLRKRSCSSFREGQRGCS